jgi:hypothetical protein
MTDRDIRPRFVVPKSQTDKGLIDDFTVNGGLPDRVIGPIRDFLLDKRTGNIKLNIKDGEILGIHIEEIRVLRT